MATKTPIAKTTKVAKSVQPYEAVHGGIVDLLQSARVAAARSVNALMTASYWEIGRRIVEAEQGGNARAEYGKQLISRLSEDLTLQFGRGFSQQNIWQMRQFYATWPILQTVSGELRQLPSLSDIAKRFPLPWSAYVAMLSVKNEQARAFYEAEALRGGWSVRQLDRQINTQFFERTALSRNKAAMLTKGMKAKPEDVMSVEEVVKDPYLNYAKAHWVRDGENPPVGLILCSQKGAAQAHYALEGLTNQVLAAEYQTVLPRAEVIEKELNAAVRLLASKQQFKPLKSRP